MEALFIHIWHFLRGRCEVMMTFDQEAYFRARSILTQNSIQHWIEFANRGSHNQGMMGAWFVKAQYCVQYKIFVRKVDADRAVYVLHA